MGTDGKDQELGLASSFLVEVVSYWSWNGSPDPVLELVKKGHSGLTGMTEKGLGQSYALDLAGNEYIGTWHAKKSNCDLIVSHQSEGSID